MRISLLILPLLLCGCVHGPSVDHEATRRVFGRFAEADRMVVVRGTLCCSYIREPPHVVAEVQGRSQVQGVIRHLKIKRFVPVIGIDPETGDEVYFRGNVIACPDHTLKFFRGSVELGNIGIFGRSVVRIAGAMDEQLIERSREFLTHRFGFVDDPRESENSNEPAPISSTGSQPMSSR